MNGRRANSAATQRQNNAVKGTRTQHDASMVDWGRAAHTASFGVRLVESLHLNAARQPRDTDALRARAWVSTWLARRLR